MKNFQDVLYQRSESYGALWCDEGVYCIAKEIQFLCPNEFQNIWLGMGPFHWSKILMAAIGTFLEPSGIAKALYKSGVFLKGAAETNVMKGGDYVQGKDGMGIIAEVMTMLQYEVFEKSETFNLHQSFINMDEIEHDISVVASYSYNISTKDTRFVGAWESSKLSVSSLKQLFDEYKISNQSNENFRYWDIFLRDMYPTLRDFELSVRKGDWGLFLDAVQRSLPIFFATGRSNYSRWAPIFYQDCLDLHRQFPDIYRHFKRVILCVILQNVAPVALDLTKHWKRFTTIPQKLVVV